MLQHNNNTTESTLSLMLNYGPLGLIRASRTLIGDNCICVDTGCIALNDNSEVEIVLSIRNATRISTYRIPATVSGRGEHGITLQFRECAKATLEALLPFVTRH